MICPNQHVLIDGAIDELLSNFCHFRQYFPCNDGCWPYCGKTLCKMFIDFYIDCVVQTCVAYPTISQIIDRVFTEFFQNLCGFCTKFANIFCLDGLLPGRPVQNVGPFRSSRNTGKLLVVEAQASAHEKRLVTIVGASLATTLGLPEHLSQLLQYIPTHFFVRHGRFNRK